jgi:exosortase
VRRSLGLEPRGLVAAGAIALLTAAVFAPTLGWLVRSWQVHPYYSHGLLVPPLAAWFAWRERRRLLAGSGGWAGVALVAAGVAVHLAAGRLADHPLSAAGLLLALLGFAHAAAGGNGLRAALLPVGLLALAVPLPLVEQLAPPLAAGVAGAAAMAAGSVGVAVVQAGAQLAVGDGAFTVGAPCSGLRSLLALATLALAAAGVLDGPLARRLALVALAVPLALAANWLRLTGLLWLADTVGAERGLAVFHGPASPVLFGLAAAALLVAGRALGCDVRPRA